MMRDKRAALGIVDFYSVVVIVVILLIAFLVFHVQTGQLTMSMTGETLNPSVHFELLNYLRTDTENGRMDKLIVNAVNDEVYLGYLEQETKAIFEPITDGFAWYVQFYHVSVVDDDSRKFATVLVDGLHGNIGTNEYFTSKTIIPMEDPNEYVEVTLGLTCFKEEC